MYTPFYIYFAEDCCIEYWMYKNVLYVYYYRNLTNSFPGADPNIRDYSGKKPKQYLQNSASTRVQRKRVMSSPELEFYYTKMPQSASFHGPLVITHLSLTDSIDVSEA